MQRSIPGDSSHLTRLGRGERRCRQHHQRPLGRQRAHLNRRVVGVSMAEFYCDQVVSFEINYISFDLLGYHEAIRDLAGKPRLPNPLKDLWGGMLSHNSHNIRCRDCSSIWEAFKKSADSKPMVSMAMNNIDCCHVLAACRNPIH